MGEATAGPPAVGEFVEVGDKFAKTGGEFADERARGTALLRPHPRDHPFNLKPHMQPRLHYPQPFGPDGVLFHGRLLKLCIFS